MGGLSQAAGIDVAAHQESEGILIELCFLRASACLGELVPPIRVRGFTRGTGLGLGLPPILGDDNVTFGFQVTKERRCYVRS